MSGRIYVVATPIGNLSDFPPRGIEALKSSDLLLCEDTRHTRKLLDHFGIDVRMKSFHEHNEDALAASIIERVREGDTISIVSDAGLPLLSDPGFPLIRLAREDGLTVTPIPGPFAGAMALVASGIAPVPFTFWGFSPHRSGERSRFWERVLASGMTGIVYESPQRVAQSLHDLEEIAPTVAVTVAREMTKLHEEFLHGSPGSIRRELEMRDSVRGEITIVVGAAPEQFEAAPDDERLREEFEQLRSRGMKSGEAARLLAERYGLDRKLVYSRISG